MAAGLKLDSPTIWKDGKRRAVIRFGDIGTDLSPHPYILMYPQDTHERLLISKLRTKVERPVALEYATQDENGVMARTNGGEIIEAKYICGCDGAHSQVREILGTGFPGGTYEDLFYVADVDVAAMPHEDEFYIFMTKSGFLLALPLPEGRRFRLIGTVPRGLQKAATDIMFDDVRAQVSTYTPFSVSDVHWFSTYHVHHRVTDSFRRHRAFLLGDAAHIHSPAGGQGMNTGIGDAMNLAWKLAAVIKGAPDALLDTYHDERKGFAQTLVATTDRAFRLVVGHSLESQLMRQVGFPVIVPAMMRLKAVRRFAFKTISQIGIHYRSSTLSHGGTGSLQAGDRLPYLRDNFSRLSSYNWQIHAHGGPGVEDLGIPRHNFGWSQEAADKGFEQGALYLIRPDGYIGYAGRDVAGLKAYCRLWGVNRP